MRYLESVLLQACVEGEGPVRVIAEIKRASPSRGELSPDMDPARQARAYRDGGAAALSVLTEPRFFRGSAEDLSAAARATDLPVLRKDFLVNPLQVTESVEMGADAVLLITEILPGEQLAEMLAAARAAGLDPLVEIHADEDLDRALEAGADLIGVNHRDLRTFEIDRARAERLAPRFPGGVVRVAESGVASPSDARRLSRAGYHAILVGEHLVRSADPARSLAELRT